MNKKIGILDFGVGNISSIENIIKKIGFSAERIDMNYSYDLSSIKSFILPGVGSFDNAMEKIKNKYLFNLFKNYILDKKKPLLGICIGMQILLEKSEEGTMPGLGWIEGSVHKFSNNNPVPHMGWNDVKFLKKDLIFENIPQNSKFYFCHSYYVKSSSKLCVTDYGNQFASIIKKENIYGLQFHPEKSHNNGFQIIENFCKF